MLPGPSSCSRIAIYAWPNEPPKGGRPCMRVLVRSKKELNLIHAMSWSQER